VRAAVRPLVGGDVVDTKYAVVDASSTDDLGITLPRIGSERGGRGTSGWSLRR
jgi:hypothetical protein